MSRTLEIRVDPRVHERFPDTRVAGFLVTDLARAAESLPTGEALYDESRAALDGLGITGETLVSDPRIAAWRAAVSECGLKPSTYRSSAEQLAKRILKGKPVTTPLTVVDNYCMVSVKHLAPLGAYDLDRLDGGPVTLRPGAPESDRFRPLGARPEDMPITGEVVVYAEGDRVLCWAFNHRDSSETSLVQATADAVFMGEAVDPSQHDALAGALAELRELLESHGARVGAVETIDAARPAAQLSLS